MIDGKKIMKMDDGTEVDELKSTCNGTHWSLTIKGYKCKGMSASCPRFLLLENSSNQTVISLPASQADQSTANQKITTEVRRVNSLVREEKFQQVLRPQLASSKPKIWKEIRRLSSGTRNPKISNVWIPSPW